MNSVVETLKSQLLNLPSADRAEIASFLLSTLENEGEDPAVVAAEWKGELLRRIDEMDSGAEPGIPAEDVFAAIRKKYQ